MTRWSPFIVQCPADSRDGLGLTVFCDSLQQASSRVVTGVQLDKVGNSSLCFPFSLLPEITPAVTRCSNVSLVTVCPKDDNCHRRIGMASAMRDCSLHCFPLSHVTWQHLFLVSMTTIFTNQLIYIVTSTAPWFYSSCVTSRCSLEI